MSGQVRSWEELRVLEVGVNSLELNREGSNVFAWGSFLTFGFSQFTVSLLYLWGPESNTTQLQSCFLAVSSEHFYGIPCLTSRVLKPTELVSTSAFCGCLVTKSFLSLLRPHDLMTSWNPSGSFIHGMSQVRRLEWVVISFSRGSSRPRDWTCVFCISRQILYPWATREAQCSLLKFTDDILRLI